MLPNHGTDMVNEQGFFVLLLFHLRNFIRLPSNDTDHRRVGIGLSRKNVNTKKPVLSLHCVSGTVSGSINILLTIQWRFLGGIRE